MLHEKADFHVGKHRPVYLWAGPGTVRMNRLKFMGAPVDEFVHMEAHTPIGAGRMAEEAGFNWAYLTYDWGFPPEIEKEDWEAFRRTVPVYHAKGIRVFGYIQTSNCVFAGSYREKDWYARDPYNRLFNYYTGRYMICWLHPEWREHLRSMVRGVIESQADGVFFDNPWHASQPFLFAGAWLGSAGCYCPRCRDAFRTATGLKIPTLISPVEDEESRRYLRWRADVVTATLSDLSEYARSLNPSIVVSANNFDAVMRPSFVIAGIDLAKLADVQDILMIEDYGLPRLESSSEENLTEDHVPIPALLVNNALTLHTAVALAGKTPVTTDPYDKGIGFDPVYTPRRFQQGMAEAAACGTPMVIKGTEYIEEGCFTLLTAEEYREHRLAIGQYHRWLQENVCLYQESMNIAPIGVVYPGDTLWQHWHQLAPRYFGVCQTLLCAGIPWRVVASPEQMRGLWALISLGSLPKEFSPSPDLKIMNVLALPDWELPQTSFLARQRTLRKLLTRLVSEIYRAYFRYRWTRRLMDRIGMVHFFLQSPYFHPPSKSAQMQLRNAVGEGPWPRLNTRFPALIEWYRRGNVFELHLVNYGNESQDISVDFGQVVEGQILSPDQPISTFECEEVSLKLDIYAVIQYHLKD